VSKPSQESRVKLTFDPDRLARARAVAGRDVFRGQEGPAGNFDRVQSAWPRPHARHVLADVGASPAQAFFGNTSPSLSLFLAITPGQFFSPNGQRWTAMDSALRHDGGLSLLRSGRVGRLGRLSLLFEKVECIERVLRLASCSAHITPWGWPALVGRGERNPEKGDGPPAAREIEPAAYTLLTRAFFDSGLKSFDRRKPLTKYEFFGAPGRIRTADPQIRSPGTPTPRCVISKTLYGICCRFCWTF
jgi:hypothetical protein